MYLKSIFYNKKVSPPQHGTLFVNLTELNLMYLLTYLTAIK